MSSHAPATKKTAAAAKGSGGLTGRALDLDDKRPCEELHKYRSDANVVAAAALRVNAQPRFQQIHNVFKNKDTELATYVVSTFKRHKTEEEAHAWMAANVGNPPGMKLTQFELIEIALVSLALTKYGAAVLNDWYDRKRLDPYVNFPLRSDELRSSEQQKYRDQSKSTQKTGKHVAHYVGLDFAVQLNRDLPEQHRVATQPLRELLNNFENFRLVNMETNLGLHKEVDALMLRAYNGAVLRLTAAQRDRVVQIVQYCQSEIFQATMLKNRGVYLYTKIRGVVKCLEPERLPAGQQRLWDERRDRRGLQAAAASAQLKGDGTPDRRFKENKVLSDRELGVALLARTPSRSANDEEPNRRTASASASHPVASRALSLSLSPAPAPAPAPAPTPTRLSAPPAARGATSSSERCRPAAATPQPPAFSKPAVTKPPPAVSKMSQTAAPRPVATFNGREIIEGPKGGRYYINDSGNKVYVKR